jgi:hypothetical protein
MHDHHYIKSVSEQWTNSFDKNSVIREHNIKPLMGTNGVRLSVQHILRTKMAEYVPVLSESNELQFAFGWPQIQVITTEQVLNESRQYRLIATTDQGEEHYSDWFDEEETAVKLQGEVDQDGNVYIDSFIQKRVKELDDEERDEDLPEINLDLKPTPDPEPEEEPEEEPELEEPKEGDSEKEESEEEKENKSEGE